MAQWVKGTHLPCSLANGVWSLEPMLMEERTPQSCPLASMCTVAHAPTRMRRKLIKIKWLITAGLLAPTHKWQWQIIFLLLQTAEHADRRAMERCGTALSAGPTPHLKRKQPQQSILHTAGKLQTTHSVTVGDKEQIKTSNTSHLHPDQENKC